MSEKKMIYGKKLFTITDDFDGQPLSYLIETLTEFANDYPNARISTETVHDDEGRGFSMGSIRGHIIEVVEDRLETDEEFERRLRLEEEDRKYKEGVKRLKEEAERKHYEMLKKKYG